MTGTIIQSKLQFRSELPRRDFLSEKVLDPDVDMNGTNYVAGSSKSGHRSDRRR